METEFKDDSKKKADIDWVRTKSKKNKQKIIATFEEQVEKITKNTDYVKSKLDNE